jgi:SAM-dependent methyltransferase
MARLLEPYGPALPFDELVERVNRIYHACEARDYDARHPELSEQLPPVWSEMLEVAEGLRPRPWRVLDYGCGTGFEAEQLLRRLPPGGIAGLTGYDPSGEMLERCRLRVAGRFPGAFLTSDEADLRSGLAPFDVLATNSLLHHLPDPMGTVRSLAPLLAPGAVWLAGHEPSSRFYRNPECAAAYAAFLRERRWRRLLRPGAYAARLRTLVGSGADPARRAATQAAREGLFARRPPPALVGLLTDLHVAHSPAEAEAGRGLDFEQMRAELEGEWELVWVRSYAHMGSHYEGRLPGGWARRARELRSRHPLDGANFSAVWRRLPA